MQTTPTNRANGFWTNLIDIVAKGGNFQVGFGPDPTGAWPTQMIERVSYVGDWLKVNGEAIYATRPYLRYHEGKDLRFTRSKDKKFLYIISLKWPGAVWNQTWPARKRFRHPADWLRP